MECKFLWYIDVNGNPIYKPKVKYNTMDDAIAEAKKQNAMSKRHFKLVSYKCSECHKYHIGRNGNTIKRK
jgi:hypothetical protein